MSSWPRFNLHNAAVCAQIILKRKRTGGKTSFFLILRLLYSTFTPCHIISVLFIASLGSQEVNVFLFPALPLICCLISANYFSCCCLFPLLSICLSCCFAWQAHWLKIHLLLRVVECLEEWSPPLLRVISLCY